jgi:molecular chaperone GrpE (heat shock protein)
MTNETLLKELRAIERRLRSAEVQTFFLAKTQATRDRFASLRNELSRQIAKLSNAQLEDIATKLDELSDDLEAGVESLTNTLDRLEKTVTILNGISKVLGLVGRVIAFIP